MKILFIFSLCKIVKKKWTVQIPYTCTSYESVKVLQLVVLMLYKTKIPL